MNEIVRNLPLRKLSTQDIIGAGPTSLGWTVIEIAIPPKTVGETFFSTMKSWCIENTTGKWFPINRKARTEPNRVKGRYDWFPAEYYLVFESASDAMLFKLVNGGNQVVL